MAVVSLTALAAAPAAAQRPAGELPVSVERIRVELGKSPTARPDFDMPVRVPERFKSRVEQRVYVLTLQQWLAKEFDLNDLQRQSEDWRSRCCGIQLGPLVDSVRHALQERRVRKTREQIARELAELEEARRRAGLPPAR